MKPGGAAPFSRSSFWMLPPKPEGKSPPREPMVAFLEAILDDARRYRDQHLGMSERWKSYRSWYTAAGEIWGKRTDTVVNLVFEKVESVVADLCEADPTILYSPRGAQDLGITEFLNHVQPFVWDQDDCTGKYHSTLKSAGIYGTAYWKIVHDPGFPNTGPRIRVRECSPWAIFPAPYATNFEDSPYIIEVRPRTVGEIKAEYGITVDPEIVSRETDMADDLKNYPASVAVETATGGSTTGGDTVGGYYRDLSTHMDAQVVFQKEIWIKDGTRIKEWVWDEQLDSPVPKLRYAETLKYPEGRVISWAGGRLLYDLPSPYRDGEFPYVRFRDGTMPDFWFGQGEIEPLIPLQVRHDDTHEIITLHHLFSAFGLRIVDTSTGIEEGQIGNDPNQILFVNPGTSDRIKWLHGMPPPAELYNYLGELSRSMDQVSGRFDITRGEQPGSVTAARALVTLQQAANIRIRHRMKDIERALHRAGRLMGSRIQQFWPSAHTAPIATPTMAGEDMVFKQFYLTPEDRQAAFNVKVAATANLDALKEQEFQKKMLLHQLGLVDDEELIEGANLTNEEEIKQKLPALKMQRMMQQMAQAQVEGGQSGNGSKKPGGGRDQTRAGNEVDQQSRKRRAVNRALTPVS